MTIYEVFDRLGAIVAYGAGLVSIVLFIQRVRTGTWTSASTRLFAAVLFMLIPAGALFRLLSRPLPEHSAHSLWLQVGLVLIWLAAGAANAFRAFRPQEARAERAIT